MAKICNMQLKANAKRGPQRKCANQGGMSMNSIEIATKKKEPQLRLQNGATSVLLTVLGLSGSRLAQTDGEKTMIVWLLEHDQSCCGRGTVGFLLSEMPWKAAAFSTLKNFMVRTIDAAMEKLGWETLDYTPNEELLRSYLLTLKQMFSLLEVSDLDERRDQWAIDSDISDEEWETFPIFMHNQISRHELCQLPQCEKHHMQLTIFGCHACNDSE